MRNISLIFLFVLVLSACKDTSATLPPITNKERQQRMSNKKSQNYNVVEKYVRSPLDQANQADQAVQQHNRDLLKEIE